MGIYIYAFLGPELQGIAARIVQAFGELGFRIEIHPEMDILATNPTGCLYMAVHATPRPVKRLAAHVPLLVRFGYEVVPPSSEAPRTRLRPFRKMREFTYEIRTSTGPGTSRSAYFMQALTAAILARETGGYFYVNGDAEAVPGAAGVERILSELAGLDAAARQLEGFLGNLQSRTPEENSQASLKAMKRHLNVEFDVNAFPFEAWPPVAPGIHFDWPTPISAKTLFEGDMPLN